jgi:hypothetical protein
MRHALTSIIVIAMLALLCYVAWRGLAVMQANNVPPAKPPQRAHVESTPVATPAPAPAPVAPAPAITEPPPVAAPAPVTPPAPKPQVQSAPAPVEQKPAEPEPPPQPALPPAAEMIKSWVEGAPAAPVEGSDPSPSPPPQSLHKELGAQERDAEWSEAAEAQLRDYFAYMVKDDWVEIISVYCGSELCEIQAATRSPESLAADIEDWQQLVASMPQQPWWASYGFSDPTSSSSVTADNRALFVAFVRRTPVSTVEAPVDGG